MTNNPYKTLGLSRTANLDIARKKYVQLSKKFHPDISKYTLQVSESKMKQINSAYSLIKTSITKGVISYRPKGRFTKDEIVELIERFKQDQTLYKIGRDMKRKQRSIKRHLILAGLMEETVYDFTPTTTKKADMDISYFNISIKISITIFMAFIMLIEPRFNLIQLWVEGLFIILN